MTAKDWPRLILTAFIMALLGYSAWFHYSAAIEQTIVAIALLAVGYWLGSSKGSADKTAMLEAPREVEVTNTRANPVPTEGNP